MHFNRPSKRAIALAGVFAVVLGGSAIGSAATLTQTLNTVVQGSLTTIAVTQEGVQDYSIAFDEGLTPGDIAVAPIEWVNAGTGYARLSNTALSVTGGPTVTQDVKKWASWAVTPAMCASNNADLINSINWDTIQNSALASPLFAEQNIGAGDSQTLCLVVKMGDTGKTYGNGDTNFVATYRTTAVYP